MVGWNEFAVILGGASAALLGLLFVAVSIKVDVIHRSIALRARSTQTMALFVLPLLAALILGIPGQSTRVFGGLISALAIAAGVVFGVLDRRAKRANDDTSLSQTLADITPSAVTCFLTLAAGIATLLDWADGIYFLAGATVVAIVGGVVNAWLLLVELGD